MQVVSLLLFLFGQNFGLQTFRLKKGQTPPLFFMVGGEEGLLKK